MYFAGIYIGKIRNLIQIFNNSDRTKCKTSKKPYFPLKQWFAALLF